MVQSTNRGGQPKLLWGHLPPKTPWLRPSSPAASSHGQRLRVHATFQCFHNSIQYSQPVRSTRHVENKANLWWNRFVYGSEKC